MKATFITLLAVCATFVVAYPNPDVVTARDISADGTTTETAEQLAAEYAQALADDDEDYDTIPDGMTEEEYNKELDAADAADPNWTPPVQRRDAEAEPRIPNWPCGKQRLTLHSKNPC